MTKEREQPEPRPAPLSLEQVSRLAKEITLLNGYHLPTVLADGSHLTVAVQISELAPNHAGRANQMFEVGVLLAREGQLEHLRRAFFISEAWMSSPREGYMPTMPPSQDVERKEVLVVTGYDMSTRQSDTVLFEMLRNPEGYLQSLRDVGPVEESGRQTESPLLEAFVHGFSRGRDVF